MTYFIMCYEKGVINTSEFMEYINDPPNLSEDQIAHLHKIGIDFKALHLDSNLREKISHILDDKCLSSNGCCSYCTPVVYEFCRASGIVLDMTEKYMKDASEERVRLMHKLKKHGIVSIYKDVISDDLSDMFGIPGIKSIVRFFNFAVSNKKLQKVKIYHGFIKRDYNVIADNLRKVANYVSSTGDIVVLRIAQYILKNSSKVLS